MQPRQQQTDPVVLQLILDQFDVIDQSTYELAEAIATQVEENGSSGTLQNSGSVLAAAVILIDAWFIDYVKGVRQLNVDIARHMVDSQLPATREVLSEAGAKTGYRVQVANKMLQYPANLQRTFYTRTNPEDGIRFDHRIKTVRLGTEQTVRNIVNVSKRRGFSANQIAADIRTYLRSEEGGPGRKLNPTELQRQAALLSKTAKPKNVSINKLPYSAKRIARSEAGNTFRSAEVEMYKGTVFEDDLYDWVLSNRHVRGSDTCDENARRSPYSGRNKPKSHPNCNCAFIKRPVTVEELRRRLQKAGVL